MHVFRESYNHNFHFSFQVSYHAVGWLMSLLRFDFVTFNRHWTEVAIKLSMKPMIQIRMAQNVSRLHCAVNATDNGLSLMRARESENGRLYALSKWPLSLQCFQTISVSSWWAEATEFTDEKREIECKWMRERPQDRAYKRVSVLPVINWEWRKMTWSTLMQSVRALRSKCAVNMERSVNELGPVSHLNWTF